MSRTLFLVSFRETFSIFFHEFRLCFEDFDRIKEQTLSIVAQQIRIIQMAKQKQIPKFLFDGIEMKLDFNCSIFIMSNPNRSTNSKL